MFLFILSHLTFHLLYILPTLYHLLYFFSHLSTLLFFSSFHLFFFSKTFHSILHLFNFSYFLLSDDLLYYFFNCNYNGPLFSVQTRLTQLLFFFSRCSHSFSSFQDYGQSLHPTY